MLELAAAPSMYQPVKPDEARIEDEAFVLFLGSGTDVRSASVERLRTTAEGLPEVVRRVRELLRAHGRAGATWEVLTPPSKIGLLDGLRSLGLTPGEPAMAVVMGMSSAPTRGPSHVEVRLVDTIEGYKIHVAITHEVFEMQDRLAASLEGIDGHGHDDLADRRFTRYTARLDGEPVGAATATFTSAGVMLHSGSTLEAYRGKGVYSALVAHRWREAVDRGTPRLITRAGPMSRPILKNLGFFEIGEVHFMVDTVAETVPDRIT